MRDPQTKCLWDRVRRSLLVIGLSLFVIAGAPVQGWVVAQVLPFVRLVYRAEPEVDPAIVLAVIAVESMGRTDLVSRSGAIRAWLDGWGY